MRHLLIISCIYLLFGNATDIKAQSQDILSQNLAAGMAELRQDIYKRKQAFNKKIKDIVVRLDSSSTKEAVKKELHEFIRLDLEAGAQSNSLEKYDLIPENHPFKNIYIEQYVANNQDYQIDRDLITELTKDKVLKTDGKINGARLGGLKKDFDFLEIKEQDRLLLYNSLGARYAMLLGYTFEGIDITIHNQFLFNHYLALDRLDRYPNINNGNVIDFIQDEDARIMIKGEEWDKIIIRETDFLTRSSAFILKSLHDNLTEDGHLYILHEVKNDKTGCTSKITESIINHRLGKADFKLIDKLEIDCNTYFKFQSIKE